MDEIERVIGLPGTIW